MFAGDSGLGWQQVCWQGVIRVKGNRREHREANRRGRYGRGGSLWFIKSLLLIRPLGFNKLEDRKFSSNFVGQVGFNPWRTGTPSRASRLPKNCLKCMESQETRS